MRLLLGILGSQVHVGSDEGGSQMQIGVEKTVRGQLIGHDRGENRRHLHRIDAVREQRPSIRNLDLRDILEWSP